MCYALILLLLEYNYFFKKGFWCHKVDHEKYGEASNILDLMWLLSQKAPVYSVETRSAIKTYKPV